MNIENLVLGNPAQSGDKPHANGGTDSETIADFSLQLAEKDVQAQADPASTEFATDEIILPATELLVMQNPDDTSLPVFSVGPGLIESPATTIASVSSPAELRRLENSQSGALQGNQTRLVPATQIPTTGAAAESVPENRTQQQAGRSDLAIVTAQSTASSTPAIRASQDALVSGTPSIPVAAVNLATIAQPTGNLTTQLPDQPKAPGAESRPTTPGSLIAEVDQAAPIPSAASKSLDGETARRTLGGSAASVAQPPTAAVPPLGAGDAGLAGTPSFMAVDSMPQSDIPLVEFSQKFTGVQAAQPPGSAPLTAQPAAAMQIIARAAGALQDRPVELTLHPAELGRVRLTLQAGDGTMAVLISVERPETLDLLRRNIDQLANQLRDIGYQKLTFDFSGQGQKSGDSESSETGAGQYDDDGVPSAHQDGQIEPLRLLLGADTGLDIRL